MTRLKVSLELGGKSPHIVFESADLDQAANWACLGILYNTGQDCTAGSRLYVQDTIYNKFVSLLVSKAKELVIGDGFDEKSGGGPLVSWSSCSTLRSSHPVTRCPKLNSTRFGDISRVDQLKVQSWPSVARSVRARVSMSTLRVSIRSSQNSTTSVNAFQQHVVFTDVNANMDIVSAEPIPEHFRDSRSCQSGPR